MRNSKEYLKNLANKIILETLEEKADMLMAKLKNAPTDFDYVAEGDTCEQCGGTELFEGQCVECGMKKGDVLEKLYGKQTKLDKNKNGRLDRRDFEMMRGDMQEKDCMECGSSMKGDFMEDECMECGSPNMYENQCMECGVMKGSEILEFGTGDSDFTAGMYESNLHEKWKGDVKVKKTGEHAGKSISDIDSRIKALKDLSQSYQEKGERVPKKLKEKISELYFAKRSKKGWPGKGKVDIDEEMENGYSNQGNDDYSDQEKAENLMYMTGMPYDEALMIVRGSENIELPEGNAFTGKLAHTPKGGKFKLGNKEYTDNSSLEETLYRLADGEENALFTENEIIDIIENIVKEEKDNIKKGATPKGLGKYEKIHKESGKENKDYLKIVADKMIKYIKSGSKGKYETNPKHFPKGNGELGKMDKKAYEVSTDGEEFIDDFYKPGMQTLDYDEMHPNEDWMNDNIEGSSRTGNNQEWANAEQTNANKRLNKTRKKNSYNKAKRKAYNKSPQPVITDKPGQEKGSGLHLNMEDYKTEKETLKLNEEFGRMKQLMGYSQKTQ
jgi:hypothetical protein